MLYYTEKVLPKRRKIYQTKRKKNCMKRLLCAKKKTFITTVWTNNFDDAVHDLVRVLIQGRLLTPSHAAEIKHKSVPLYIIYNTGMLDMYICMEKFFLYFYINKNILAPRMFLPACNYTCAQFAQKWNFSVKLKCVMKFLLNFYFNLVWILMIL